MRVQKFSNREDVRPEFISRLGLRLSGYTNTASVFLLKSLSELENQGRMAYIMPLEFLNTEYGSLVKREMLKDRILKNIVCLSCEKEVFPDALTMVGIFFFEKRGNQIDVGF